MRKPRVLVLRSPAPVLAVDRRALGIGGRRRPLGLGQGPGAQDRRLAERGQSLLALQVCVGAHMLPGAAPRFDSTYKLGM
jgi:hypothetical protein